MTALLLSIDFFLAHPHLNPGPAHQSYYTPITM